MSDIDLSVIVVPFCCNYKLKLNSVLCLRCDKELIIEINSLCEFDPQRNSNFTASPGKITLPRPTLDTYVTPVVECQDGHVVNEFLACDGTSSCLIKSYKEFCSTVLFPAPPSFMCKNGVQHVPYTLVCDHRPNCVDNSDETFCHFKPCLSHVTFDCGHSECFPESIVCDNMEQCVSGGDESRCSIRGRLQYSIFPSSPTTIDLVRRSVSGRISFMLAERHSSQPCPMSHFKCPGSDNDTYMCLPVYLRCNGVADCQWHEDELDCDSYTCPGFYRCRGSRICVHKVHICDRMYGQCPQNDDEWVCDHQCPESCRCYGWAFYCNRSFSARKHPELRYLHAKGSNMTIQDLEKNMMLVYLSLERCLLHSAKVPHLPNLQILDLRDNLLTHLPGDNFKEVQNLHVLILAGNPLDLAVSLSAITSLRYLHHLDISRVDIPQLDPNTLKDLHHLHTLNLSQSNLIRILDSGFQTLTSLHSLDILGCPVTEFPRDVFKGLSKLHLVVASNYKMCCRAVLPVGFDPAKCSAPHDEISSCEDLLRHNVYRVTSIVLTVLTVVGNITSVLYRAVFDKNTRSSGFGVFVVHLCLSDFLMGVYLMMIGVADTRYHDTYLWYDFTWKHSIACKTAGFLSLLSSEVSAILICIITIDRFLVMRFPFSHFHFHPQSAQITSSIVWLIGISLAITPLLPFASHWRFYSQTGICIPLPISRKPFDGHGYSFGVLICLNFVLFLVIAAGQGFIYWSVTSNTIPSIGTTHKSKDLRIARRLVTVAVSDFLCWFPVGLLGMLALGGSRIPGEVSVAIAICVLPLNSALNPFLYTVNVIMEHRRNVREKQLLAILSKPRVEQET